MATPTVQEIFEQQITSRLRADPGLGKEIGAIVQFEITGEGGGSWTLDCTGETHAVAPGTATSPKLVVTCAAPDFVQIATKELNANMAAMSGKLKFKPMDMGLAMKLGKLLA